MALYDASPYFGLLSGGNKDIEKGFQGGQGLGNLYYGSGLPQVSEQAPGALSDLEQMFKNQIKKPTGPILKDALAKLQGSAGMRSDEMKALLEKMVGGLGGLEAKENQALKESGQIGLDQSLQTALRQLRGSNLGTNAMGPAASISSLPAIQQFAQAQQGLERDLTLANVAEKQRRQKEYSDMLSGLETTEFGQKKDFGNLALANQQYQTGKQQTNLQNYSNALGNLLNWQDTQKKFNIGQKEKGIAGQMGLTLGGGGFGAANWAQKTGFDVAKQGIEAMGMMPEFPEIPQFGQGFQPGQGGYPPDTGSFYKSGQNPGWGGGWNFFGQ